MIENPHKYKIDQQQHIDKARIILKLETSRKITLVLIMKIKIQLNEISNIDHPQLDFKRYRRKNVMKVKYRDQKMKKSMMMKMHLQADMKTMTQKVKRKN